MTKNDNTPVKPSTRDQQMKLWRTEAKAWILENATRFIDTAHEGAFKNPEITTGQVVAHLDDCVPVPGYELLRSEDNLRYQVVRNTIEQGAKDGLFDVSQVTNSRGKEAKAFSPAGWTPSARARKNTFDVLLDGVTADEAERVSAKLSEWLEDNHITATTVYVERVG